MTDRELAELLQRNPDLSVEDDLRGTQSFGDAIAIPQVKMTEHDLQAAIVAECDRRSIRNPAYALIHAIPNGQFRQGQRMEPGLRAGVPDLMLPVARGGYHGLYCELKCGANKPSREQLDWIAKLRAEGYKAIVVWDSVMAAMIEIELYLEG